MLQADATADRPNLDLLRSVAVSYVLVFHLLLFFGCVDVSAGGVRAALHNLGLFGVFIFFVHTSLVLLLSLGRMRARGGPLFGEFMIRRVFRIYPASIVMVLLVTVFRMPVADFLGGHFVNGTFTAGNIFANLALVQNIPGLSPLLAPLWSLPFEMQMYLLLPPLFIGVRKLRSTWSAVALWFCAAAFAFFWHRFDKNEYCNIFIWMPDFLAGVLCYRLIGTRARLPWWLFPFALAAVTIPYLARPALPVSWLCCFALAVLLPLFKELPEGRLHELLKVIARYSYGIYLTHFAAIWFAFVYLARLSLALQWLVFIATTGLGSALLYHLVEAPFIGAGSRVASRRRASEAIAA